MNLKVTSKEELLEISKRIAKEEGIEAINIRTLARRCDISVGAVYNYFPSKEILLVSVVEEIWNDIFDIKMFNHKSGIVELVENILISIEKGKQKYPNFIGLHSLSFNKANINSGKNIMELYFARIKMILRASLENSGCNGEDGNFSKDDFIDILFNLIFCQFFMEINKKSIIEMVKSFITREEM